MGLVYAVKSSDIIIFLDKVWDRMDILRRYLVTDNGHQFVSEESERYLKHCSISHHCSAAYWPGGNTAVGRFNCTLKSRLQECTSWTSMEAYVDYRLASYKATLHCSTSRSPSKLLHGRQMRLKLPVIKRHTQWIPMSPSMFTCNNSETTSITTASTL